MENGTNRKTTNRHLDELYGAVTRFRNQGCRPKIVWLEEIISLEKEFEASAVLSETTKNTGKTK